MVDTGGLFFAALILVQFLSPSEMLGAGKAGRGR